MKTIVRAAMIITLAASTSIISTTAMGATINERQDNQQARIKQGIQSGELTRKEAHRLGKQQIKTHRKEAYFKSDGTFTKKERAIIQRDLSRNSAKIYRQKHDGQSRK